MRSIIQYLRSCFCKHDWKLVADNKYYAYSDSEMPWKRVLVYRCTKCGLVQKVNT